MQQQWGRGSGRTSSRSRNNNGNSDSDSNDNKTEKVEFTPHCAGKMQGTAHDTVKKQIIHNIGSKCECRNDLVESIENKVKHNTKEELWTHLKFTEATFVNKNEPTEWNW